VISKRNVIVFFVILFIIALVMGCAVYTLAR
jgi:hypothetical protein